MEHFEYATSPMVCSRKIAFDLDEEQKVHNLVFTSGCNGNLKAISKLVDGMKVDDIEAKLSIICVRNKVSFDLDKDKEDGTAPKVFNLNSSNSEAEDLMPTWLKAVQSVAKNKR